MPVITEQSLLNSGKANFASFLLRVGLASVFLYAGIDSFLEPNMWVGFLPAITTKILPAQLVLFGFSAYEIFLALWFLANKKIFYAACLSALTLLAIIIQNLGIFSVVFRDVAILFSALALAVLNYKN